ncbi:HAD family hydrolase [Cytophaga sp. FL35]|uniref:HAD family hydrolase n=1 Tax=Cytophaga sp. FL35 TaxID=1904456 RepID=UPI0016534EC5|nr:HAD family hydrolase [Cytophaga sp. FL35]MBC6997974.1 HAD family hydrolase [Cytophaga sp. FL35]
MDIKVSNKTVIVFDLDDTLYNEISYLQSAYQVIARQLNPNNCAALYAQMFSLYRSGENVFKFLSEQFHVEIQELISIYRDHVPNIEPFKGVGTLLKTIKKAEGKIGLITDGRSRTQRNKLEALNIVKYFDKIVISEEIGSEKPSEANYKAIEKAFPDCIYYYIGDNIRKDFISPNKLGWESIGIIDNGLNIHFDGHKYMKDAHMPKIFMKSVADIRIVS